jgi:hypothetical protein
MPRITPTQFYTTEGMTLRSGKKINYIGTTAFQKESLLVIKIIETYNRIERYEFCDCFYGQESPMCLCLLNYLSPTKIPKYLSDIIEQRHCPACAKLIVYNAYLFKWRNIINKYHAVSLRDITLRKITESIKILEKKEASGHEYLCGCTDTGRRSREAVEWFNYEQFGPGAHVEVDDNDDEEGFRLEWIPNEDITPEEYVENVIREQLTWRHNLAELLDDFDSHKRYFDTVPHVLHQATYFKIASKIPQDCAMLILSYL